MYCYAHPQRETLLRCNRCEKPICIKCAQLTPTGYRCKECVQGQQKHFDTSIASDYIIAPVIAGVLAFLGSLIIPVWFILVIFGGPIAGTVIAEVVRFAVKKRRSRKLFTLVGIGTAAGCLPMLGLEIIRLLLSFSSVGTGAVGGLFSLAMYGLYAVVVTATAYYRLSGIQIRF